MLRKEEALNLIFEIFDSAPHDAKIQANILSKEVLDWIIFLCLLFPSAPAYGVIAWIPFEAAGLFIPEVFIHI
jgi:hypothetical protein